MEPKYTDGLIAYDYDAQETRECRRYILDMSNEQPNNPLHGITLEKVVTRLQEHYGWEELAEFIDINCFKSDPSIKSSLKFLRKTQWARNKVERLYISTFERQSPWGK
ncbi:DNA-binding protein [BD1-7 clade bacterium]|nr:DNA-binding protein [BD1-7 clade bacterium]